MWTRRHWMALAALLGFVSVAAGAFGAHGIADPKAAEWLRTGATYGFVHVLATLVCGALDGRMRFGAAPAFFLGGVALFSGSLYAMALGAPHWLGAVTPLGGLGFLIGWLLLARAAWTSDPRT